MLEIICLKYCLLNYALQVRGRQCHEQLHLNNTVIIYSKYVGYNIVWELRIIEMIAVYVIVIQYRLSFVNLADYTNTNTNCNSIQSSIVFKSVPARLI